jgi:hypothetical protein
MAISDAAAFLLGMNCGEQLPKKSTPPSPFYFLTHNLTIRDSFRLHVRPHPSFTFAFAFTFAFTRRF